METNLTIMFPAHPAIFAVFLGLLVLAMVYYGIKFVVTLFLGG